MEDKLVGLYLSCFDDNKETAFEIINFARENGRIIAEYENSEPVSMLCLAQISQSFPQNYMFAAATKPEYRKRGMLAGNIKKALELGDMVCIPASASLYPMYEKLGLPYKAFRINAQITGSGEVPEYKSTDRLYEIYLQSNPYPCIRKELFMSAIRVHLLCGGRVFCQDGCFALEYDGKAEGVFAETNQKALEFAKKAFNGKQSLPLPLSFEKALQNNGIEYQITESALMSCKMQNNPYFNNLYN